MSQEELQEKLLAAIQEKYKDKILSAKIDYGMPVVTIDSEIYIDICKWLKEDSEWNFNHFIDITAVDYYKSQEKRYQVVVHLRSHKLNLKVRIKVSVAESDATLPTLTDVFIGALWTEREVYDLMGITFTGHPRMTRLLNPDDFEGHPLRKEFPVKGKHRGSFPRGTVISNKRREPQIVKATHPKPLDQLMPRTPRELKREPVKEEASRG